jgi:hypothetical protein
LTGSILNGRNKLMAFGHSLSHPAPKIEPGSRELRRLPYGF